MDSSSARIGPADLPFFPDSASVDLHTDRPHPARIYDYLLGGKDNFPADREAAEQTIAGGVDVRTATRQNRAFLHRVARYLATKGIRQYLDIGTGIPTSPNLHEITQAVAPESRVVYVDNDPIVLAHARALLTSTPRGRTAYIDADLRDRGRILSAPELVATLDLGRPLALSLLAILHFVPDGADPYGIVRELVDALPAGSYVALSHATGDLHPDAERSADRYRASGVPFQLRSRDQVAQFVAGLELVEPGIAVVHRWRPDAAIPPGLTDAGASFYGVVARKS